MRPASLRLAFCAMALLMGGLESPAQQPAPADISVQGADWTRRDPFTELRIHARTNTGEFVGIEFTGSSITRWTDDKGTDLGTRTEGKPSNYETVWYNSTAASDHNRTLEISICAKKVPAPDAKTMTVEGVLHMRYGTKKKTGEAKLAPFTEGSKFKVPPFEFTIRKIDSQGAATEVVLEAVAARDVDPKSIEDLKFLDSSGKPIPVTTSNQSTYAYGDQQTRSHRYSYHLKGGPPAAVQYVVWEDLAERKVPFKVEAKKKEAAPAPEKPAGS